MNRRFAFLSALASVGIVEIRTRAAALAQGLPTPGPGATPFPATDGGGLAVPAIIVGLGLLGALIVAVAAMDLRRKRRAQAIVIEGQIADTLMREPRLRGTVITALAEVPLTGRSAPTVEVRGEVQYPELRDIAVRIVRQELLRYHPDGRVEDRMLVLPPIPVAARR